MLLRWSSLWHTEGGVGGMGGRRMNVLWTALEERHCDGEDVVALKMLLCWRCCFVEDLENVATLKMLLRWRCWRCCYVEDVVTFRMLLLWRCFYVENVEDVAILKKGDVLSLMVLRGIMTSLWDPWKHWNSINMQFYWFPRNNIKWRTWKTQN